MATRHEREQQEKLVKAVEYTKNLINNYGLKEAKQIVYNENNLSERIKNMVWKRTMKEMLK